MLQNSPVPGNDLQLVSGIQDGNMEYFGILYDKYAPALLGLISRIIPDKHEAEDILAESFMEAYAEISTYDLTALPLFCRLMNIARRRALSARSVQELPGAGGEETLTSKEPGSAFHLVYYRGLDFKTAAASMEKSVAEVIHEIRATFGVSPANKMI